MAIREDETDRATRMAMTIFERALKIWDQSEAPRATFARVAIQGGAGLLVGLIGQDGTAAHLRKLADDIEAGEIVEEMRQ